MKVNFKTIISLLAIMSLLVLTACGGNGNDASGEGEDQPTIGISLGTLNNPFFVSMQEAAEAWAEENGAEVLVESADYDLAQQTQQIEDFITKNVDLIILNAADTSGIAGAVQQAKDANIPVVAVDVEAEGGVDATITSDNHQAGVLAGEKMIEELGGEGNVVVVTGPPTSAFLDRVAGFNEALEGSNLNIIAEQNGGGTRGPAQETAENILQANPEGEIDAIFGANDPTALGVYTAAQQANRDEFFIIGVDGSPDFIEAMENAGEEGILAGTSAQFPSDMIEQALDTGMQVMNGEEVEELIRVPVEFITPENMDSYEGWVAE